MSARKLRSAVELVSAIGALGFELQHHGNEQIAAAVTLLRTSFLVDRNGRKHVELEEPPSLAAELADLRGERDQLQETVRKADLSIAAVESSWREYKEVTDYDLKALLVERDQLLGLAQAFLGDDADDSDDLVLHVKNALTRLKEASDDGWGLLDQIAEALEVSDGGKEWDRTDLLETANKLAREVEALRAAHAPLQQQVERIVKRAGKRSTLTLSTFDIEELRASLAQEGHVYGRSEVGRTDSADGSDAPDHQRDLATRRSRGQALVQQWREQGAACDAFHATMGSGWKACADQLEKLLGEAGAAARPAAQQTDEPEP